MQPILQSESAECGLACIAMVANAHDLSVSLVQLRQQFPQSLKGLSLKQLIDISSALHLTARPVKLSIEEVGLLQRPAILHWDLNHFVVLVSVTEQHVKICDPARGLVKLTKKEFAEHFTGIALELTPTESFKTQVIAPSLTLADIRPKIKGLNSSLIRILMLSVMLQVFVLIMPFYMQLIVDDVMVSRDEDLLLILAIAFGFLVVFQQAFAALRGFMVIHLGASLARQFTEKLLCHLLKLPTSFFAARHVADIVSRFQSIEQIKQMLANKVVGAVIDGLMAIVTLIVIFNYEPTLTYIVLAAITVYFVIRLYWYAPLKSTNEVLITATAAEQAHFMESIRSIQSIKLMALEGLRINGWLNKFTTALNKRVLVEQMSLKFQLSNAFLFGIENVLIIYLGASLVLSVNPVEPFTLGMLLAFIAYKNQATARLSSLVDTFIEFKMLSLHFQRIADIALTPVDPGLEASTNAPLLINENTNAQLAGATPYILKAQDLSFSYPQEAMPVFKNVNLSIKAGQSVAIIGLSGVGKSSLLQVLNGLLPFQSGTVRLFCKDLKTIENRQLRRLTATVMQSDTLLSGTIAENIAQFEQPIDFERVQRCAQLACIESDILALPMQYQTYIGEMGSTLSGGQTQRLIIARALYFEPKILFLDEATSHLDVVTERKLTQNLRSLNVSQFIIAHRSETIRSADRVMQLHPNGLKEVTKKIVKKVPIPEIK